jgi:hypothetical protein
MAPVRFPFVERGICVVPESRRRKRMLRIDAGGFGIFYQHLQHQLRSEGLVSPFGVSRINDVRARRRAGWPVTYGPRAFECPVALVPSARS